MRRLWLTMCALLALCAGAESAQAQGYPNRTIRLVVPYAPGGGVSILAQIVSNKMSEILKQPIVIDNRPGAGGNTGTQAAAKATPDGYTLVGSGTGPLTANKVLYRDLGYDPEKDLEPISQFAHFNIVVVASTKLPVNTLSELIAHAKQNPGLNYGSVGIGSSQHLGGAYFEQLTGLKLTHVPYRNIAQYGPDLMAGTVQLGFQWLPNVNAPLKAGGAKPLAVASKTRMAALPDVPTSAEAGLPDYIASGWFALLAPRGTPKEIVAKLNSALAEAINDPAVRARFHEVGAEPAAVSPEDAAKFLSAEMVKWRDIITKAGVPQIN
jgi:tripartite-type tricarboxylate transporter receptor subunit TctC